MNTSIWVNEWGACLASVLVTILIHNKSSDTNEVFRIFFWHHRKGLNQGKVVPHQQNIEIFILVYHGSVLGPKNYSIYIKPVGEIIKWCNIRSHCYGDDHNTQVYITLKPFDKWGDISSSAGIYFGDTRISINRATCWNWIRIKPNSLFSRPNNM